MQYLIDVVGTCNLRCPSCPVGNFVSSTFENSVRPKGFMSVDLFKKILNKIRQDTELTVPNLALYNWGEPFLHPQITDILQAVADAGLNRVIVESGV